MWDRLETGVALIAFFLILCIGYCIYLVGLPFAWFSGGRVGAAMWRERFSMD